MDMEPDRSIATVLFTDIVGSTKQLAKLGDAKYHALLQRHHGLVRIELDQYGGREISTSGDSFLAVFENPAEAIPCALAIRDALHTLGLEIRVGIHTGEIEERADDVGGIAVHIGARVLAIANAGEILVSNTTRDLLLGSRFEFTPRGTYDLKGVPGKWRLYSAADTAQGIGLAGRSVAWMSRLPPRVYVTTVVVAIVLGLGGLYLMDRGHSVGNAMREMRAGSESVVAPDRSIAVLPFVNLSGDPENEYFSDGITEQILTTLAQIDDLKVISRTSVMQYKGTTKNVRMIGAELGVATILEGSVQRSSERVRITAQLVEARSDKHLWANTYDRELTDIFSIQSDVAKRIAGALQTELTATIQGRLERAPTSDLEAYQLYLKGLFFWNKRTEDGLMQALDLFERAIERDPDFALAHAALATTYAVLPWFTTLKTSEVFSPVEEAARRALELDEGVAEAHTALGAMLSYQWKWEESNQEYRQALELNPGHATSHHWFALNLVSEGRYHQAREEIEKARELDPLSLIINTESGLIRYYSGQIDAAIEEYQSALQLDPEFPQAHEYLWMAYEQMGDYPAAIEEAETTLRLQLYPPHIVRETTGDLRSGFKQAGARGYWSARAKNIKNVKVGFSYLASPTYIASIYANLGNSDLAFDWLERDYKEQGFAVGYAKVEPGLAPLRDDPRFTDLLTRLGLD